MAGFAQNVVVWLLAVLVVIAPIGAGAQPRSASGGGSSVSKGHPPASKGHRLAGKAHRPAKAHISGKQRCACPNKISRKHATSRRSLKSVSRDRRALRTLATQRTLLRAGYLAGIRPVPQSRPRLLDGWQIRLIDGDTFAYGGERIRIRGINAPELSEAGGFEASQRLDLLLREGPITVIPEARDVYGRTVADVFVNQSNVAEVMATEGYAKK